MQSQDVGIRLPSPRSTNNPDATIGKLAPHKKLKYPYNGITLYERAIAHSTGA